jgi:hypothetical protein
MITKAYLNQQDACLTQQAVFERHFPQGIAVTEELAVQHADKFDWIWAIENLLEDDARRTAMQQEFEAYRVRCIARDKIDEAYDRKPAHTDDEVRERLDALAELKLEYQRTIAAAFARAFLSQDGRPLLAGERTSGGVLLTDKVLDDLADEAEQGYDPATLQPRSDGALL